MKHSLATTACLLATALVASAQVPSLINYQGRLTDATGAPVTGSKNFVISIYDAASGGNLLYTETIGAVTLDANGVYNFQFGGSGTSNTQVTENLATTDGTAMTFQRVLANSPVVAGSVSVTDGTYTWTQSTGSSNEDEFGVAYSTSLRRVTANYYSGAPAAGRTLTATYRYGTSGITGALSGGAEHWIAVSVDGTPQVPRQRVLAVPFAHFSRYAEEIGSPDTNKYLFLARDPFPAYAAKFKIIPNTVNTLIEIKSWSSLSTIFDYSQKYDELRFIIARLSFDANEFENSVSGGYGSIDLNSWETVYQSPSVSIRPPISPELRNVGGSDYVYTHKINFPIKLNHEKYVYALVLMKDYIESSGSTWQPFTPVDTSFRLLYR